jgi:hypothetical protein
MKRKTMTEAQLDAFLAKAKSALPNDIQDIVGELHPHYGEAPIFVLLYLKHDLVAIGRVLAQIYEGMFPGGSDGLKPTFAFTVVTTDHEYVLAFIDEDDVAAGLRSMRPFAKPEGVRREPGASVFGDAVSLPTG